MLMLLGLFSSGILGGCRQKSSRDYSGLKLPETPLYSDSRLWGVVKDPYLRISAAPGNEESTVMTLRQGEIVSVLVIQSFESGYWCRIRQETREGWTLRDSLDIYNSRAKAENGSILRLNPEGAAEP